jgi:hypothetical protein
MREEKGGLLILESPFILGPQTLMCKKTNEAQQMLIEDMVFQICKNY